MPFNHRLVKHDIDNSIGIYEIFYDANGLIKGFSDKPIIVGNDLDDLAREMFNLQTAFIKPILTMDVEGDIK